MQLHYCSFISFLLICAASYTYGADTLDTVHFEHSFSIIIKNLTQAYTKQKDTFLKSFPPKITPVKHTQYFDDILDALKQLKSYKDINPDAVKVINEAYKLSLQTKNALDVIDDMFPRYLETLDKDNTEKYKDLIVESVDRLRKFADAFDSIEVLNKRTPGLHTHTKYNYAVAYISLEMRLAINKIINNINSMLKSVTVTQPKKSKNIFKRIFGK